MSEPKHYGEGDPISIYCEDIDEQGILPFQISDILYDMRYKYVASPGVHDRSRD